MVSFLTLYRGSSLAAAELIAVTTDPELVAQVAGALLKDRGLDPGMDSAVSALKAGRRRALRIVRAEAEGTTDTR
jgi:hypothetical protein